MALFQMPKLSDTMEEGTILSWLVGEGEEVAKGQPLVEIETDKATMTVESPAAGALQRMAAEGDVLPVGADIAAIGEDAPVVEMPPDVDEEAPEQTNIPVGDDGTVSMIGSEVDLSETYPGAREEEQAPEPVEEPPAPEAPPTPAMPAASGDHGGRIKSSPLARRRAAELGVDIASVRGTGPDGRVVQADVEAAADGDASALRPPAVTESAPPARAPSREPAPATAPPAAAPAAPPAAETASPGKREPLSRLQQTVARRMVESKRDAPHFYIERDVDATDLISLRRELVAAAAEDEGPSINDLLIRAVAVAGAADRRALRRYDGDALVAADGVHVGIAVAVDDGLLVPVVRDADRKSVGQLAAETRDLVARAREGTLRASELEGSTISISNLGMFGIDRFSAVLNPPEPAILAVGRATATPVVRDGQVVVRDMMTLTMSVDHRSLYGADGAVLLGRIAEGIEQPHALVL